MRLAGKKFIVFILYILLLLGCLGIVVVVSRLAGDSGSHRHPPEESGTGSPWETEATPSDAVQDGQADAGQTENGMPEDGQTDREDDDSIAWSEAYRRWYWKNRDQDMGLFLPEETVPEEPYVPPTIMMASDLHYMSSTTHDEGKAFWKMVDADDGKLNQYSEEMIDALVEEAIARQPSALVLSGDITLNGERENHEKLAQKLRKVQEAGVPVAVIPGNHDINNKNAATYFGDKREEAEYLHTGEEFWEIYHEFGYDQSPNRDPDSLSYVFPVDAGHWLLMIDSCQYEDYNHVNGRLKPETLAWLEVHLQVAKEHGIQVLPVAHHNLLSQSRLYKTECTLENYDEVILLFERYEVPLYVSGHLHAQRIKKHKPAPGTPEEAYGISEIVLSPYSMPPNQYGELSWTEDGDMVFETRRVDVAAYMDETEALQLPEEGMEALSKTVIKKQVMKTIQGIPDDLKETMGTLYANLYYDYCAGNRMTWDTVQMTKAYLLWQRVSPDSKYVAEMGEMIEDVKEDLHDWEWENTGPGFRAEPAGQDEAGKAGQSEIQGVDEK